MSIAAKNRTVTRAQAAPRRARASRARIAAPQLPLRREVEAPRIPETGVGILVLMHLSNRLGNLERQVVELRGEVALQRGKVVALRADMATLRTELQQQMAAFRVDLQELMGELSQRMARIETLLEVHFGKHHEAPAPAEGGPVAPSATL